MSGGGNGGLGDILVGLEKSLVKEDGWKPNVIAGVQHIANSGGFSMNLPLGNNYNLLRGTLNVSKEFDPLVFVGQFGFGHGFPAHGFDPGNEYDALVGAVLSVAPESSMRFELQQQFFDYGYTQWRHRTSQRSNRVILHHWRFGDCRAAYPAGLQCRHWPDERHTALLFSDWITHPV